MHKILSLTVIGCLLLTIAKSQGVAINSDGSAPDTSAMLDVKSSNKGVLIPRLSLTGTHDSATIHFPKTSLLVYNTATAGGLTPGFYYWNKDTWTTFGGFNYVCNRTLTPMAITFQEMAATTGSSWTAMGLSLARAVLEQGIRFRYKIQVRV